MAKKKEAIGFEKALRDISNRHSINQLFDDFLQMIIQHKKFRCFCAKLKD